MDYSLHRDHDKVFLVRGLERPDSLDSGIERFYYVKEVRESAIHSGGLGETNFFVDEDGTRTVAARQTFEGGLRKARRLARKYFSEVFRGNASDNNHLTDLTGIEPLNDNYRALASLALVYAYRERYPLDCLDLWHEDPGRVADEKFPNLAARNSRNVWRMIDDYSDCVKFTRVVLSAMIDDGAIIRPVVDIDDNGVLMRQPYPGEAALEQACHELSLEFRGLSKKS